jgi:uncharacterized protein (TIGR02145 family)
VVTDSVFDINVFRANGRGNVLIENGAAIIARGFCWSLNPIPTINDFKSDNGPGLGTFVTSLTSLLADTIYYVRAYAQSSIGIAYGNQISFRAMKVFNPGNDVTYNGFTYPTIVLGNGQEWMAANLRTSKYSNGDTIPNVTDNTQWQNLTTGAWCYNNNDSQYENPYGKLYNWYTVNDPRNVCPTNWHVPTHAEWSTFINYLDPNADGGKNYNTAGGKMKSTGTQYWFSPNTDATNESGFSGLPGGNRTSYAPYIIDDVYQGWWWSSTEFNAENALLHQLSPDSGTVHVYHGKNWHGFSVRCIKD